MPKENDSIVWSSDIGERMRELQKQEGRGGAESVGVTDASSLNAAGELGDPNFPHFQPLNAVPPGFKGIVLMKYPDGRFDFALGGRCANCVIPLAEGCCFERCSRVWLAPRS